MSTIRPVKPRDAKALVDIYNYYMENTTITFEEEPLSEADMKKRIRSITKSYPWFVYEKDGEILGCAYADRFRSRCAYKHSVEVAIYLRPGEEGRGLGTSLYQKLFDELRKTDAHAAVAAIALPHETSIKLHEKFGFKKTGHLKEVGHKHGKWINVGYWERILGE